MKCENEINVLKQNGTLLVTCHVKEETTRGTNPQLPRTTPAVRKSRYFITSSPRLSAALGGSLGHVRGQQRAGGGALTAAAHKDAAASAGGVEGVPGNHR